MYALMKQESDVGNASSREFNSLSLSMIFYFILNDDNFITEGQEG